MSSPSLVQDIAFPTSGGRPMKGWLGIPEGRKKSYPAVLVIHELTGLVWNIRPIVQRFAENGYMALAPNLFDKPGSKALCVAKTMLTMATGKGEALEDLEHALYFLSNHEKVDAERLAAAGFCMGGGFALLMALNPKVKASAPYYGMSAAYLNEVEKSCPIVASYGAKDAFMGAQGHRLKKRLERAGIAHDVKTYEDAGHSFMTEEYPGILGMVAKAGPLKVAYHHEHAEESWGRMLGFFGTHV